MHDASSKDYTQVGLQSKIRQPSRKHIDQVQGGKIKEISNYFGGFR